MPDPIVDAAAPKSPAPTTDQPKTDTAPAPTQPTPAAPTVPTPAKAEPVAAPAQQPTAKPADEDVVKRLSEFERQAKEKLDAIAAREAKALDRARLQALRRMGADPDIVSDEDLLALAPKVDPDEPAGAEALKKWRDARQGFFRSVEVGPQERLSELTKRTTEDKTLAPHLRERKAKMLSKLYGGS